ncbi:hypothetical protein B0H14DRAFT_2689138 [Mycena olivaceomarginata]|nr:hypothetical protein B0H14DRAFT_2689138 [Mycena olivaceomarginata]
MRFLSGVFQTSDWALRTADDSGFTRLIRIAAIVVGSICWGLLWLTMYQRFYRLVTSFYSLALAASFTASVVCSYLTVAVIRMMSRWAGMPW